MMALRTIPETLIHHETSCFLGYVQSCVEQKPIPKMLWKDMYSFSDDSVLLVLSDTHYDPNEYIRNYNAYIGIMKGMKGIED